jgi:hypothetical protein
MKIKTKKYKHSPDITSKLFTDKMGNHKFEANIFKNEDGTLAGELTGKIGRNNIVLYKSDATLKHWLEEAKELADFYSNLHKFLNTVNESKSNKAIKNDKVKYSLRDLSWW